MSATARAPPGAILCTAEVRADGSGQSARRRPDDFAIRAVEEGLDHLID